MLDHELWTLVGAGSVRPPPAKQRRRWWRWWEDDGSRQAGRAPQDSRAASAVSLREGMRVAHGAYLFMVWAPDAVVTVGAAVAEEATPLPEASHRPRDDGFLGRERF